MSAEWSLVIHGGAGIITRANVSAGQDAAARRSLEEALDAGSAILAEGGSAIDAVVASVQVLEDAPSFNAGRGAVFTYEGATELDAAIMDGETRAAGAVAGVTRTRNPISLAKAVMTQSPHVLLAGAGADRFSAEQGLEQAGPEWFVTPERARQLDEIRSRTDGWFDKEMKFGTVGAVARDTAGHLAAATSTGGVMGKRWGRIGDSPVIGAGTYADDRSCAVSATGSGEFFLREAVGHEIGARIRLAGEPLDQATATVLDGVRELGGSGGVIVVAADGGALWHFNTAGMYRGRADGAGSRMVAIYGDE